MDEDKLKKIIQDISVPEADENAKKRAVNLAMAEFQAKNQKESKKFQGFSIFSRLMGSNNPQKRRLTMEQKSRRRLYQGTAMLTLGLCLVTAPVIFEKMQTSIGTGAEPTVIGLSKVGVSYSLTGSSRDASSISSNIESSTQGRRAAKKEQFDGASNRRIAEAVRTQGSAMPVPTAPPKGMIGNNFEADDSVMIAPAPYPDAEPPQHYQDIGKDKFEDFKINPITLVSETPVSTFSVDVDTASYSFIRGQLNRGVLPAKDSVRTEELINYFDYNYALPESKAEPFKPTVTITDSPWAEGKKLMHVGIKGFEIDGEKPKSNLVFLLDVSGSMNSPDKLPLVKNSMKMLLDNLNDDDTVSIVVYAGAAGAVLEPTKVSERSKIIGAFDKLSAGGSTAGAAGINLAYQLAEENFDEDAVNRVILATDGDFNVGITNREELKDFVERKRNSGIFLSVLGFGQGNYNDHMMQTLAQNGNGVAAYIDTLSEARKVLVDQASSSLFTIAKDVKIQMEFNPNTVAEYRLVGYETRHLEREDFNNDKVDAGDIGAGHTVTAIYEITPTESAARSVDPLRYGGDKLNETKGTAVDDGEEYAFLKIRYKLPKESKSKLMTTPITLQDHGISLEADTSIADDTEFATAVASFGQILQGGKYTADFSYDDVIKLANEGKGDDLFGYRAGFIEMVRLAKSASAMKTR